MRSLLLALVLLVLCTGCRCYRHSITLCTEVPIMTEHTDGQRTAFKVSYDLTPDPVAFASDR